MLFLVKHPFGVEHSMGSVDGASVVGRLGFAASTSGSFPIEYGSFGPPC